MKLDIFNKKRIAMLEAELNGLRKVKDENSELKRMLAEAETELRLVLQLKDNLPADCKQGLYCEACTFAKRFYYHKWGYYVKCNTTITGIMCGKGESCKNFIQKEIEE